MVHVHDQLKDQASRPRLFGGVDCRDSFHRLCVLDDQGRVLVAATDGHDVAGPELLSDQLACLANAFPNAVMIHTPVHASWLNQLSRCAGWRRPPRPRAMTRSSRTSAGASFPSSPGTA